MGCAKSKDGAVSDPQSQQRRDEQLARRLQKEEERSAAQGGRSAGQGGGRPQAQPQVFAGQGRQLGGGGEEEQLSAEERRQRALEAAEKRQVNLPGVSQQKAVEMREKQQKDELLGKLAEYYHKKKMELPMGLNAASAEQLRKHWDQCRRDDTAAQVLDGGR